MSQRNLPPAGRQRWSLAHLGPGVLATGTCSHSVVWGFTGPPLWPVRVRCGQVPRQALPCPGASLEEELSPEDPSTGSWLGNELPWLSQAPSWTGLGTNLVAWPGPNSVPWASRSVGCTGVATTSSSWTSVFITIFTSAEKDRKDQVSFCPPSCLEREDLIL